MKLLLENWREFLSEEEISVEDIHKRADEFKNSLGCQRMANEFTDLDGRRTYW